jgi:membrane protein DedA with SNARE-associated domain
MHSLPALGALLVLGSAVPFMPTGELVSGSAALTTTGLLPLAAVFLISWLCSLAGDTALLLEARLGRRHIQGWLERHPLGHKVRRTQTTIDQNAFQAVVTGRLIPGGRAPVILALGLSQISLRRFLAADTVACAVWAALYTGVGAVGGAITGDPLWGLALAVVAAIAVSALLPLVHRLYRWLAQPVPGSTHGGSAARVSSSARVQLSPAGAVVGQSGSHEPRAH